MNRFKSQEVVGWKGDLQLYLVDAGVGGEAE